MITEMNNFLAHHGVKGMKWGVRRYQNKDGSLTSAGKKRRADSTSSNSIAVSSSTKRSKFETDPYDFNSEEEYEKWVSDGMPKRESKTYSLEDTTHTYKSKGSNKGRTEVDKLAKDEDYWEAGKKYDMAGMKAIDAYSKGGKDAVTKLLKTELKGVEFEFALNDSKVIETGESSITFSMKAYGKDHVYSVYGESDYSDDQYFYKRNRT